MTERSAEAIRHHYEVETKLAAKLLSADREARAGLYSEVYEEMYTSVPDHPMLVAGTDAERAESIKRQLGFVDRYLGPETRFLEIGAGDCRLSFEVAKSSKSVVALEVSETISAADTTPDNFELRITDGIHIPLEDASVDLAYSNQLMEHLHPDDSSQLLAEIQRVVSPGGIYLCVTPSRLTGPHDVSRGFTEVATGFHLHEYTIGEVSTLFREAGFKSVGVHLGARGHYLPRLPASPFVAVESMVDRLPRKLRKQLTEFTPIQMLLNVRVAATN